MGDMMRTSEWFSNQRIHYRHGERSCLSASSGGDGDDV